MFYFRVDMSTSIFIFYIMLSSYQIITGLDERYVNLLLILLYLKLITLLYIYIIDVSVNLTTPMQHTQYMIHF